MIELSIDFWFNFGMILGASIAILIMYFIKMILEIEKKKRHQFRTDLREYSMELLKNDRKIRNK